MTTTGGFTESERSAMTARAEELRVARGGNKRVKEERACLDAIAEMPAADRAIAERIHAIVLDVAPGLAAKTWYGMPAYAQEGKVVCFVKGAAKFGERYASFGFNEPAQLDDGPMWPTAFAVTAITDEVEKAVADLVRRAVG
ncbi:DUF1801 domain-containing protein [Nocardioides sp. GY 10113]|uniref:iron chaperone n=1 Tax=Nocardioides sp. GY 10113 TaxID=2569761 RepID=UPI0010A7E8DC|nr:DUF1801 domain-containing protein [Nocardioides sp. GY 10113]TIC87511.1 DUF1801 domain-containing protein [Nocardioides sp. GY 10113]